MFWKVLAGGLAAYAVYVLRGIRSRIGVVEQQGRDIMLSLQDFKVALEQRDAAMKVAVERATTVEQSVKVLVEGQAAQLTALRKEVADLQNAGVDVSVLQPTLDKFDASIAAVNKNADDASALVIANTPSA